MPNPKRPITPLKILGRDYRREDLNNLVVTLNKVIEAMSSPGPLIGTSLQLTACPYTGAGLSEGGVFVDGSNHLVMVRGETAFATPLVIRLTVAPFTVSTS